MVSVAVIGAGGHSRVIYSILKANHINPIGFFDDSYGKKLELIQGSPVLGNFMDIVQQEYSFRAVYLALGSNSQRKKWYIFLVKNAFNMPPLIHPSTQIEKDVTVGMASVICIGAIVGTQVNIGEGCIINTGCSVDHESSIGDFTHIAPGVIVAGRTNIGSNTFVGLNTTIVDKITIGNDVVIGAGSIILADVPDGSRVVGIHK